LKVSTTRLVLVRHGESRAIVDEVVGGHEGCKGLTDNGRRQAEALRDRLALSHELDDAAAVYSSILPRAVETAEIIAPVIGGGHRVEQDCDLCEIHPGEGDGLGWAEFAAKYGNFDMNFEPWQPVSPGGESVADFNHRIGTTLARLARQHRGETIVLVCHGGVIVGSMIELLQLSRRGADRANVHPIYTSLTEWSRDDDRNLWTLVRFNDHAHLAALNS
jgi:probable phosphoglycerate mutase